jgi:hypothetical protein
MKKKENPVFFNSGRRCLAVASPSGHVRSTPAVAALVRSRVMVRLTAGRRTQTSCASRGEAGRVGSAGASTQLLPARRCPSIGGGVRPAAPCTTRITDRRDLRPEFLAGVMAAVTLVLSCVKRLPVLDYLGKPAQE